VLRSPNEGYRFGDPGIKGGVKVIGEDEILPGEDRDTNASKRWKPEGLLTVLSDSLVTINKNNIMVVV
jgi:hypothetical protein